MGDGWTKACDGLRRRSQSPNSAESTMKQPRPFVVEIKQKRGLVKRPESIWAGIDLAAIANDVAKANTKGAAAEAMPQPIVRSEDVRSVPVFTTVEVVSDTQQVIMPDASLLEQPTVEEAPVPDASHAPPGDRRARSGKRWRKDVLPRSERWKRRLPWVLRQSRGER